MDLSGVVIQWNLVKARHSSDILEIYEITSFGFQRTTADKLNDRLYQLKAKKGRLTTVGSVVQLMFEALT